MTGGLTGGSKNIVLLGRDKKGGLSNLNDIFRKLKDGNGDSDDDNDDDNNDDDDDDDDDKNLAARTIKTIRFLYEDKRLSLLEKKKLISDIIENVGTPKFSKAEVAFSLFVCGGRPGIDIIDIPDASFDLSVLDAEDVNEFEEMCHSIYAQLK